MNKVHAQSIQAYRQHGRTAPETNRTPNYLLRRLFAGSAALAIVVGGAVGISKITDVDVSCTGAIDHTVEPGDTYSKLAVSIPRSDRVQSDDIVSVIEDLNPGVYSGSLAVGNHIELPAQCTTH